MLVGIAIVLIVLWILGLVTSTTLGGVIYVLLIVAVALLLVHVSSGTQPGPARTG